MITREQIADFLLFLEYLEQLEVRPDEVSQSTNAAYRKSVSYDFRSDVGSSKEQRKESIEAHIRFLRAERYDDVLEQTDFSQEGRRKSDKDFAANLRLTKMSFARFIRTGELPSPHFAFRLGVLLRKEKKFDLSDRLKLACTKHAFLHRRWH